MIGKGPSTKTLNKLEREQEFRVVEKEIHGNAILFSEQFYIVSSIKEACDVLHNLRIPKFHSFVINSIKDYKRQIKDNREENKAHGHRLLP